MDEEPNKVDVELRRRQFLDGTGGDLRNRLASTAAELRASEERYRTLLDSIDEGFCVVEVLFDPVGRAIDYRFVEINPSFERLTGIRNPVGRRMREIAPEHEEHWFETYGRIAATGVSRRFEHEAKALGRWYDVFAFRIGAPENRQVAILFNDVSARKEALKRAGEELEREHALSEGIVSTARVIVLRLDEQGRILSFNPYMEELCGYSLEEVRGKDWFETFLPERDRPRIRPVFDRAICGERTRGNINPIRTRDGREVLVEWYDATLQLPGEALTLICIGHDVTARDRMEKEYLQAQKMEAVGRLAAGVAHDVNNLLAGISGGLRIASKELTGEHAARKMLEQVGEEVERGASITRRLLDFSRVGKKSPTWIDPRETLANGERMLRRLIGEDVEVKVESDGSRSRIFADPGQLEQAVLNLAINARDAMPRGGKLGIRCRDVELSAADVERLGGRLKPGAYVLVAVEDDGCGMNEETRRRAVDPFFTTKDTGLGTGLGLPSVAATMKECGGRLAIESTLGLGTRVSLYFPRATEPAADPDPAASSGPGLEPAPEPRGGRETILLVEDEPLVRMGVAHILRELGYTVAAVKDSSAALAEIERPNRRFDLLLTDVVLPGMSGPEFAKVARTKRPGIRVLLMSAFPAEELVAQGRIVRGTPTLEKPFSDEQLVRKIREALDDDGNSEARALSGAVDGSG
jgi:PAS domain S-box-containing protein